MTKPPAPDAPAQADALLGLLKERSPEAAELALLLVSRGAYRAFPAPRSAA